MMNKIHCKLFFYRANGVCVHCVRPIAINQTIDGDGRPRQRPAHRSDVRIRRRNTLLANVAIVLRAH